MTRFTRTWLMPFATLMLLISCKPNLESNLAENTSHGKSTVTQQDLHSVTTSEILNLIRTSGDTYQSESFKAVRYCANCIAQRRVGQIAESMVEQQLRFLQGVFVDGAWGDFKMVIYDAPSLAYKGASGLYKMHNRFSSFLASYGSMVSEYYTGKDHLGFGSEKARKTIDKTVSTLMSMSQFLTEKGYANAEALAKKLYMLYKNPSILKNAIYDMVRLLSSGLTAGHGFARSISCDQILTFFNNWIPRLMGLVAYELLIDVVLGFVTAATAGAAGVALGAKIGLFLGKLARIASKMPYVDEIIAGFKKLAELVVRLVKRGEDVGPLARNADEGGNFARNADGISNGRKFGKNPCRVFGLTSNGGMCKVLAPTASSWKKHGARLYADLKNVFKKVIPFKKSDKSVKSLVAVEYQKLIDEGTLKYLGFTDDVHDSYHVYEFAGNVYLTKADGTLVSRWAAGAQGRGNQRIQELLTQPTQ